jgi:DedD protein
MDSRAKQRLTGAVILVALFVLLVPELLTGPKDAVAPATPEEEGLRRYTIDLNAPAASGEQQPSEPGVSLPPVASPQATTAGDNDRAQPGEAAAPEQIPDTPAPNPQTPAPAAVAQSPGQAPARPAPATTEQPAVRPIPSPPAAQTSRDSGKPPVAAGSFVVQLGSFSSKQNAEKLTRDMTAKGFATFIAPITTNGRELYRVRVGPTRDRASAEALAAQLKRMGQSGSIVPIS